jgi:hypothetical protein
MHHPRIVARGAVRLLTCGLGVLAMAHTASASVLFDNGPIVTNPTGVTGSIAGLPISNADGFTVPGQSFVFSTSGVGASVALNTALADDFTVTGNGWDLDQVTLFAFQTSQTSASVQSIRVNLWTQAPFVAGSPGAPSELPTPVLAQSLEIAAGPGTFVAHRQSATGTSAARPVFSYTVSLDGLPDQGRLAPGTYWLEWSFVGASSPSANVFVPLVSPRSSVSGHNARQFAARDGQLASPRVWFEGREGFVSGVADGRAYELPFVLRGSEIPGAGTLWLLGIAAAHAARRRRS